MATTIIDGPWHVSGSTQALNAPFSPVEPDPNTDAGPSLFYQGDGVLDPRMFYPKDQVVGGKGLVQAFYATPRLKSIGQIPAAIATNNIATVQHVVSGTAMTLAAASTGITLNVPIRPFSSALNGSAAVISAMALDFGFAFGDCTANSATIVVSSTVTNLFEVGMPLVIGGVGNSAGTTCLLTQVASIVDATHITVVASAVPLASNATAPIGTGDFWASTNNSGQLQLPAAAYPFFGKGPGLFLDPRQAVNRGLQITGAGGSAGGTFLVSGWDVYGQWLTDLVTVGAASTGYTTKCIKYLSSVVPQFTDAFNYTVGTSDVFGFNFRSQVWEDTQVFWAGLPMVAVTGWTAAVTTTPATNLTGDVRGTIQVATAGAGSGIGATASNGTVSGLAMSGNRLEISQFINMPAMIESTPTDATGLVGVTQA